MGGKENRFMPAISSAAPGPLYQQIIDGLKRDISEAACLPGLLSRPSASWLRAHGQFDHREARLRRMEREGIIYRRQGLGTFVAENGDDRSRKIKTQRAQQLMREALREASEAGLNDKEILEMFRHLNGKRES